MSSFPRYERAAPGSEDHGLGEVDAGRRRQLDGALPEDPQPGDPLVRTTSGRYCIA